MFLFSGQWSLCRPFLRSSDVLPEGSMSTTCTLNSSQAEPGCKPVSPSYCTSPISMGLSVFQEPNSHNPLHTYHYPSHLYMHQINCALCGSGVCLCCASRDLHPTSDSCPFHSDVFLLIRQKYKRFSFVSLTCAPLSCFINNSPPPSFLERLHSYFSHLFCGALY